MRISDGGTEIVDEVPVEKHFGSFLQNKLLRKVGLASGVLLGIITLLVVGTLIFQKTHKSSLSQAEKIGQIKDQSVKLQDTTASTGPSSLRTGVATLFVNGDVSVQGLLRFNNGANYGQFDSSSLNSNQTYKLPNASGTICLDSGNCQFASAADLAGVQSTAAAAGAAAGALEAAAAATKYTGGSGVTITGSVITNSGVLSVNGSVGDINLQGTANQVIITNTNGVNTFALPQDIGLSSAPTFGGLVLNSVGTQNGFNLCDQSNNCGYGVNSIVQGGNAFGTDIQVGASDDYGLQLLTNNTNRLSISHDGIITLGGANSDRITALAQFSGSTPLVFQGGTDDFFTTSLVITNPTSNRNIILPNADGTVCLSSGNCSGAGGYGDVLNGGNNFNSTMTLGTNDNFALNLKTNNVNRITISNTGTTALLGNVTSAADVVLGTNSTNRLTINSQIAGATPFIFQGATNDGFATTFSITDPTANHNITFPNADGTVCLSSGNCTGPVGTGDVLQGGNNFGGTMILGTNDNFGFNFKTNNTTRLTISNTGAAAFAGDLTVAGNNVFGASSTNRITFNGQILGGSPLVFQGATDNAFATFLLVSDPTATRTITLPNADGTICLSSGNCSTSGGTGDVNNGGNNYNSTMVLGTNDNFGLNLKTNNTVRLSITNGGQVTVQGNFIVNGDTLLGATSAQSVTFQAQNLFAPNDLNIDTYTQYIDTTHDQVGFGTLPLGTARVSVLATNAGDALTVNNGQSAGNILNLQDNGVNVVTVANEGYTTFRNSTNNAAAFKIQNAAGATIMSTDTTNRTLSVNGGPSTYSFTPTGPLLGSMTSFTTGTRPFSVATGNFNGDAYPDMVTANNIGETASVLMGNGNGTFANKVDYPTTPGGSSPEFVSTGDFNGDGKDDFVVANYYGPNNSVFINNGNGTFAARVDYPVASRSYANAVADFNNDGKPDIAASTTANGERMSILINNGNGTFASAVNYNVCASSSGGIGSNLNTTTGDFNGDGYQDIAVSCNTTNNVSISILRNNGNGTFATAVNYTRNNSAGGSLGITAGDFNGDGRPDLATAGYYSNISTVWINNGTGTFNTGVDYGTGAQTQYVTNADYNGDGIKDLLFSNYTSNSLSLLIGNGNGTFASKVDYSVGYAAGVAAADFNQDGKMDAAVTTPIGTTVGVLLGNGSSTTVKNSLSVTTATANDTALFIKAFANQNADLIRVTDSNGSNPILSLSGTGALYVKNTTNSTTAFQLQNVAGTNVLTADTTNSRVGINLGTFVTPSNTLTINGLTTADSLAQVAIGTGAATNKGLVIQGVASQTANLLGVQDSTGAIMASISGTGAAFFKNNADSTTAFQIQNAAGTSLVNADTTNLKVSLSNTTAVLSAWTTSAQNLVGNRYNGTAGVYNGYVYLVGDEGSLIPSYAKLNADGTTGAWTNSGNSLPERRASASGTVANGYYYLVGGQNATVKVNTVLYSKLNADGTMGAWQSAANTLPQALSGGATVAANGYLYHIGGTNGVGVNNVYYARLNADGSVGTWTNSANTLPALRASGSAVVSGGYVYYVGGSGSNTVYYAALNSDGSTGAWQTNANTLPAVRNGQQALVAFAGTLYLSGGLDASTGTTTTYYATLNGNGSTNAWATSAFSLPATRAQNSNVVANGYLYVLGSSSVPTNGVYYTKLPGAQTGLTVTQTATTLYNSLSVQNADASTFINADIPTSTLTVNGSALYKNAADNTTAFRVQNAAGTNLFTIDTLGNQLTVGGAASATPALFVVAQGSSASDPTGTNGAIYYNTNTNKFRCYQNGAWTNCTGSGGAGTGDVNNGGNTYGAAMSLGTLDNNSLSFITNGTTRGTFDTNGGFYLGNGITNASPSFSALLSATGSTTVGTTGAALTIRGGAGATTGTGSNGGIVNLYGGAAGGSGNNNGGGFNFQGGQGVNLGNGGTVTLQGGGTDSGTGGDVAVDGGFSSSGTNGAVTIGTTYASGITIGRSGVKTTVNGVLYVGATGTAGTVEKLRVNTPTTVDNLANVIIGTSATTSKGLVIQGTASQTADLQQWQSSAGTALAKVSAAGAITSTGLTVNQSSTNVDLQFTRSDTNKIRIGAYWNSATAYGVTLETNITSTTSYANGYGVQIGNNFSSPVTSGNYDILRVYDNSFSPASGSSELNGVAVRPIINQTGTASGITRGLYVAPTLTSAVDFRGVEIANTSGKGLWQTGASVPNFFAGNVGIGSSGTAGTVEKLRVNTPTTVDNLAATILSTGATTSKGLVVQGVASQTANLQEWQNSTGANVALVSSGGNILGGAIQATTFLAANNSTTALSGSVRLANNTSITWRNAANSADVTGLTVNASDQLQIGGAASANPTLLLFGQGNSSDPTGTNGAMYYNTNLGKFRCYQAGAWTNCIGTGGGGGGTGDVNNGGNSYGGTMVLGTTDNFGLNFITNGITRLSLDTSGNATFNKESNHILSVADSTTSNVAGGNLTLQGAAGNGSGNGGAISLTAGASGLTNGATAGNINLTAGSSGAAFGNAGNVVITAGQGFSTPGTITLQSGNNGFTSYGNTSINTTGGKVLIGSSQNGFYLDANQNLTMSGANVSLNGLATPVISSTSTSTSGGTLPNLTLYFYTMTAVNAQGETIMSAVVSQITGSGAGTNTITLNWATVPGATSYKIYRNTANLFTSGSLLRTTVSGGTTSFIDTGAATGAGLPPTTTTGGKLVVQGWASQTANLQEWQDSAGTVLTKVDSSGNLTVQHTGNASLTLYSTNSTGTQLNFGNGGSNAQLSVDPVGGGIRYFLSGSEKARLNTTGTFQINSATNTVGTVEKFRVNTPTTVDNAANAILSTSATTSKGLVIQGIASQAANLQEWQDSTGAILASVSAAGNFATVGQLQSRTASCATPAYSFTGDTGTGVCQNGSGVIGFASQGNVRAVLNGSTFMVGSTGVRGTVEKFRVNTPTTVDNSAASILSAFAATDKALVVQGVASQSANLTEWQSSAGTVLTSVSASGVVSSTNGFAVGSNQWSGSNLSLVNNGGFVNISNNVSSGSIAVKAGTTSGNLVLNTTTVDRVTLDNTANAYFGNGITNAAPANFALNATGGLGTNIAGANLTIAGGKGTGTGVGGNILFQYAPAGASGASSNNLTTAALINGNTGGFQINDVSVGGTVQKFSVNLATTVDNSAVSILSTGGVNNKGLVIQGVASQAGNLQEWQSSAGVVLASISASGSMTLNGSLNIVTGSLKVAGVDRIDNTGSLVNVSYNGSTIAVAKGGTGATSLTANGILFGNGSGAIQSTAAGNSGQCLNAVTGSAPVWASCTPAASGNVNQGGNNFGSDVTLGATDNFGFNILANNFAVAKFSNTGQATFQNGTDSVTALQVQNAAGTSLFNIDSTNSRVYVGNPTADGTGTLLVLDTKNTSGDPTGVNGAMYYNSNLGKFRCYEAGSWKDCIYTQQTATKTSDQTMSSTSYADVSSLSFNVVANQTYKLSCSLLISVPSGTNGGNLSTNGPASPSQYTATFAKALDQSSGDNYATSSTFDDGSAATTFKVNTVSTGSNRFIVSYNSILVNGANSGTWSLRGKAFDGSSSITFYANSSCDLKPL